MVWHELTVRLSGADSYRFIACEQMNAFMLSRIPAIFRDGDTNPRARNLTYVRHVPPRHEGRFAIVTIRGAGCGGAAASGRSEGCRAQARIARTHPQGRAQHPEACERCKRRQTNHAVRAGSSRVVPTPEAGVSPAESCFQPEAETLSRDAVT